MNGIGLVARRRLLGAAAGVALWPGLARQTLAALPAPVAAGLAFDARTGSLFEATAHGLMRGAIDGRYWKPVPLPIKTSEIASVTAAPKGPNLYVAVPGSGVLRSDDDGRRWSSCNEGLPATTVSALAAHAERPDTVYAWIAGQGIYRSEDAGRSWRLMDAGPRGGITSFVHSNMPGSMQSGWLFAASPRGVQRSMDCFCGWRDAGSLGRRVLAVAYEPRQPSHVYAATEAGVMSSVNGGEAWSPLDGLPARTEALTVAPDGTLYAAAADGALLRREPGAKLAQRIDA